MADRQRIQPDDEVYRVRAVWLGPKGLTLPFTARYTAWGIWLAAFVGILVFEKLTWGIHMPPMWELSISIFVTYVAMLVVDYDRPWRAHVTSLRRELTRVLTRRPPRDMPYDVVLRATVGPTSRWTDRFRHAPPTTGDAVEEATPDPAPEPTTCTTPAATPNTRHAVSDPEIIGTIGPLLIAFVVPTAWTLIDLGRNLCNG